MINDIKQQVASQKVAQKYDIILVQCFISGLSIMYTSIYNIYINIILLCIKVLVKHFKHIKIQLLRYDIFTYSIDRDRYYTANIMQNV